MVVQDTFLSLLWIEAPAGKLCSVSPCWVLIQVRALEAFCPLILRVVPSRQGYYCDPLERKRLARGVETNCWFALTPARGCNIFRGAYIPQSVPSSAFIDYYYYCCLLRCCDLRRVSKLSCYKLCCSCLFTNFRIEIFYYHWIIFKDCRSLFRNSKKRNLNTVWNLNCNVCPDFHGGAPFSTRWNLPPQRPTCSGALKLQPELLQAKLGNNFPDITQSYWNVAGVQAGLSMTRPLSSSSTDPKHDSILWKNFPPKNVLRYA